MSADLYAQLARMSLEMPNFDSNRFIIERAYLDTANHVCDGRIAIVHIDREKSVEDDSNFADGSETSATGVINSSTYLLIGDTRCTITGESEYDYSIPGHSGGVDECNLDSFDYDFDDNIKITRNEFDIIKMIAKLTSCSKHFDVAEACDGEHIPACFINFIENKCELFNSSEEESIELRSYDEWCGDRTYEPLMEPIPEWIHRDKLTGHVKYGRITILHINRELADEDSLNAHSLSDESLTANIIATVYMLIDGEQCAVKSENIFLYEADGYGGITACDESYRYRFEGDVELTKSEYEIINVIAELASYSKYSDVKCVHEYTEMPKCFINYIVKACSLYDSTVGSDEHMCSFNEHMRVH